MIDTHALLLGFVVGLPVSVLFFLGLWWGMRRALASTQPALILAASFLGRATLLLGAGLWLARAVHPLWAPAGFLLAFVLARMLGVRRVRRVRQAPAPGQGY